MKRVTIHRFSVGSFAKVLGFYQATIGFIVGLVVSLGSAARIFNESSGFLQAFGVSAAVAAFAVIILPALLFVVGWVQGAVLAFLLNIIFRESKGLEIEVTEEAIKRT